MSYELINLPTFSRPYCAFKPLTAQQINILSFPDRPEVSKSFKKYKDEDLVIKTGDCKMDTSSPITILDILNHVLYVEVRNFDCTIKNDEDLKAFRRKQKAKTNPFISISEYLNDTNRNIHPKLLKLLEDFFMGFNRYLDKPEYYHEVIHTLVFNDKIWVNHPEAILDEELIISVPMYHKFIYGDASESGSCSGLYFDVSFDTSSLDVNVKFLDGCLLVTNK